MIRKSVSSGLIIVGIVCILLGLSLVGLSFGLKGVDGSVGAQDSIEADGLSAEDEARLDSIMNTFLEGQISFSKQVLFENSDVRITATGLELSPGYQSNDGALELSLLYENYSDRKLYFSTRFISVDQYSVDYFNSGCGVEGNDKADGHALMYGLAQMGPFDGGDAVLPLGLRTISEIEVEYTVKAESGMWEDAIYQGRKTIRIGEPSYGGANDNCFLSGLEDGSYSLLTSQSVEHIASDVSGRVGAFNVLLAAVTRTNDQYFLCVQLQNTGGSDFRYSISDIAINGLVLENSPYPSPDDSRTVSAGKYAVSAIDITPLEEVKDCFQLNEIGSVSFLFETEGTEKRIAFDIPGKQALLKEPKQSIYTQQGVHVAFQGFYQGTQKSGNHTEPEYKMIFFVKNTLGDNVGISLDCDSLFFNYKKIQFAEYQTMGGDTNYRNFGLVPGGCSGYIIYELDRDSIESNHFSDLSVVTDIEMKITTECWGSSELNNTELLRFTVQ